MYISTRKFFLIILTATLCITSHVYAQQKIIISHKPLQPLLEKVDGQQVCNVDFIIENTSADTLTLTRLSVSLYDSQENLLQQRFLDNNGTAPSIATIAQREWQGKQTLLIFNPFPAFPAILPVKRMVFELIFEDTHDNEVQIKHEVVPVAYQQAFTLILPVKQKFIVYDGHDLNAHHRRFNYEFEPIKALGFTSNFMRYAHDFVVIDEKGQQHSGSGEANTDWFGFGKEVIAVGAGKVVAVQTNHADNKTFDVLSLAKDPLALYGNYVVIEHSTGVYSVYGHLKQNSVPVKTGERIKQGQKIGEIGTSGSSFFPHLHFEMRNSLDHSAEGLPAYFSDFSFIRGSVREKGKAAVIDTGDIVKSN